MITFTSWLLNPCVKSSSVIKEVVNINCGNCHLDLNEDRLKQSYLIPSKRTKKPIPMSQIWNKCEINVMYVTCLLLEPSKVKVDPTRSF